LGCRFQRIIFKARVLSVGISKDTENCVIGSIWSFIPSKIIRNRVFEREDDESYGYRFVVIFWDQFNYFNRVYKIIQTDSIHPTYDMSLGFTGFSKPEIWSYSWRLCHSNRALKRGTEC